ncbi:MAG TPA: GFA family protein [Pseudomonadales bacterium]|nr:GFA family protein [Pseudomonadales bacterium]
MIEGSCLCGAVRFRIRRAVGPLELCHCSRCRKAGGAGALAGLLVAAQDFEWIAGRESIRTWEAPLLEAPPLWRHCFCGRCGATTPDPSSTGDAIEIPAGLLDGDPGNRPDRHIFVEHAVPWLPIADDLPQLDAAAVRRLRSA